MSGFHSFLRLNSIPFAYVPRFVYSSVGGYLGSFHHLKIVKNTALHIGCSSVCLCLCFVSFWEYTQRWNCWIWILGQFYMSILGTNYIVFCCGCIILHHHQQCMREWGQGCRAQSPKSRVGPSRKSAAGHPWEVLPPSPRPTSFLSMFWERSGHLPKEHLHSRKGSLSRIPRSFFLTT